VQSIKATSRAVRWWGYVLLALAISDVVTDLGYRLSLGLELYDPFSMAVVIAESSTAVTGLAVIAIAGLLKGFEDRLAKIEAQ